MNDRATILHVDLDAFFVAMELLRRPVLRGKPVIVAGSLGERGVVNTCSYEARAYGVRSAMAVAQARRLCPHATYLASDYAYYGPASTQFHAILREYTPLVEPAGADEAYLDVRGAERLAGSPEATAEAIRTRIRDEIGITASVGVATSKLVAKIASDANKPDGLCVVPAGDEAAFLAPRPLRELPGVGATTAQALEGLGIRSIGELAAASGEVLRRRFGRHASELQERARGVDHTPVRAGRGAARSISRETTFARDVADADELLAVVRRQADEVATALAKEGRAARTVTLKLRFPPFETITRATTAPEPLVLADEVAAAGRALFERAWAANHHRPVRLLGVGVTNLQERARQLRLGEGLEDVELDETVRSLRRRFGRDAVGHGVELPPSDSSSH